MMTPTMERILLGLKWGFFVGGTMAFSATAVASIFDLFVGQFGLITSHLSNPVFWLQNILPLILLPTVAFPMLLVMMGDW